MEFNKLPIFEEIRGIPENLFITGDAAETLAALREEYAGQAALMYMDPPFLTGKRFEARVKVGEAEWRKGNGSLVLNAYEDKTDREAYLAYMKRVLLNVKPLMKPTGLVFVHIDWRMDAYMRLLLDEIFGEKNFLNEIIWTYESGGRAKNFFSRKHDVILMYSMGAEYDFHPEDVAQLRTAERSNHMKRMVDEDGRSYRTIKSNGKIYRYYDDEPVIPSDVWSDIGFLQQKDPQRTGYDTQKPLALLERIVKCASRKGDIVLDPFAGSGTTLEAAHRLGRRFIGIDSNPLTAQFVRRRTDNCRLLPAQNEAQPDLRAEILPLFAGYEAILQGFSPEPGALSRPVFGLDAVDSWAAGTIKDGVFTVSAEFLRTQRTPALTTVLNAPLLGGNCALRISDILGRDHYYTEV